MVTGILMSVILTVYAYWLGLRNVQYGWVCYGTQVTPRYEAINSGFDWAVMVGGMSIFILGVTYGWHRIGVW